MVIAVYNNKGGVGKTTLATHIYRYLSHAGERWAFYDADPQRDGLSWLSGHNARVIEEGEAECADLKTGKPSGCIITTDIRSALELPNIIVDAPPRGDFLRRLSEHAPPDLVIVPVGGRLSVEGAGHVVDEVTPLGGRVVIVFNMTDPRHAFSKVEAAAVRRLGIEVFPVAIPRSDAVRKAELRGTSAWEVAHAERTHAVKALRRLCEWVVAGAGPRDLPAVKDTAGDAAGDAARTRRDLWDRLSI